MIPVRSRSDSWTFTPGPYAIGIESNFSRCPVYIYGADKTAPGEATAVWSGRKQKGAFCIDAYHSFELSQAFCTQNVHPDLRFEDFHRIDWPDQNRPSKFTFYK